MLDKSGALPYAKSEARAWAQECIVDWHDCPVTPFLPDSSLDEEGLRNNVEQFIGMGETALVCGGFVAEGWNTTVTEWMRYHEVIAEAAGGRIPLHTIIFDPSVHQAMEKLNYCQSLGYVAAEIITPIVQLRADDEIFDYYNYLAEHSDMALLFYRSAVAGHLMSLELSQRCAENIPSMVGMKQGSLNHDDSIRLHRICPDDFIVSDPLERHWLNDLREGSGKVLYGAFHHILYGKKRHLLEEYTSLARAGKWEEAHTIWQSLAPLRDLVDEVMIGPVQKTFTYATTLGNVKAWYDAMGLAGGTLRAPMRQVTPEFREQLQDKLRACGII